jgi:hypothetical protein
LGDAFERSAAFVGSALAILRVLLLASFHLVRVGVRDKDRVRGGVKVRVRVGVRVRVRWAIMHRAETIFEMSLCAGETSRASATLGSSQVLLRLSKATTLPLTDASRRAWLGRIGARVRG